MKAHQIFQETSDELGTSIFQFLRDEQREVYQASVATLTQNRRLRPVFIQRKPAAAQIAWLLKNIRLKASNEISEHVLQLWLMKAHQNLLVEFLDGVGIEHDGEGAAEDLPDELDAKKLKSSVEKLLADHDSEVVKVYLRVFQLQKIDGWPELSALIAETPAIQFEGETFGDAEPATEEKEEEKPAPTKKKAAAKKKSAPKKKAAAKKEEVVTDEEE